MRNHYFILFYSERPQWCRDVTIFFSFSLAFVASLALLFCFPLSSVFSPIFLSLHPSSPHIMVWMKFMDEVFVFVTYTLRFDTFVKCCWNITIIYRGLKSEIFGKLCAWKCIYIKPLLWNQTVCVTFNIFLMSKAYYINKIRERKEKKGLLHSLAPEDIWMLLRQYIQQEIWYSK